LASAKPPSTRFGMINAGTLFGPETGFAIQALNNR
jgi:hypothetical protein